MSHRTHAILNFLGFQLNWFACILGAAAGLPWVGPVVVTLLLLAHLGVQRRRQGEVVLIAVAGGLGYVLDSVLVLGGAFSFPEVAALGRPSTVWMVAMWMNFAATLRVSMRWLQGRSLVGALVGAIGGPLAYFAGARLGAITLPSPPWSSLAAIGLEWAVATPLLARLAGVLDARDAGVERPPGAAVASGPEEVT